jgi:hypothetical protein
VGVHIISDLGMLKGERRWASRFSLALVARSRGFTQELSDDLLVLLDQDPLLHVLAVLRQSVTAHHWPWAFP